LLKQLLDEAEFEENPFFPETVSTPKSGNRNRPEERKRKPDLGVVGEKRAVDEGSGPNKVSIS
jgi:hypothetical protein